MHNVTLRVTHGPRRVTKAPPGATVSHNAVGIYLRTGDVVKIEAQGLDDFLRAVLHYSSHCKEVLDGEYPDEAYLRSFRSKPAKTGLVKTVFKALRGDPQPEVGKPEHYCDECKLAFKNARGLKKHNKKVHS